MEAGKLPLFGGKNRRKGAAGWRWGWKPQGLEAHLGTPTRAVQLGEGLGVSGAMCPSLSVPDPGGFSLVPLCWGWEAAGPPQTGGAGAPNSSHPCVQLDARPCSCPCVQLDAHALLCPLRAPQLPGQTQQQGPIQPGQTDTEMAAGPAGHMESSVDGWTVVQTHGQVTFGLDTVLGPFGSLDISLSIHVSIHVSICPHPCSPAWRG